MFTDHKQIKAAYHFKSNWKENENIILRGKDIITIKEISKKRKTCIYEGQLYTGKHIK
ncbi:hypothetical protein CWI39_2539p0010 [Hamiltosporidium magnivora]|uniref:Uncharacterized protein n=1 Tax=Hamiltosporidium magnivora TaxID=148818 RepID=A0A4Q9KV73_9MICR|nr:hypothetical protein CWI39_2539p0010 [Hamiltosporidium magnivora]